MQEHARKYLSPKLTQNQSFLKISYISYTSTHNIQHLLAFSVWFASPFCSEMQGKAELRPQHLHQSYILHLILHPILHQNTRVTTTGFSGGCRKCRRFSKNFGSASIWVIDIFLHVLAWLTNLSDNQHIN